MIALWTFENTTKLKAFAQVLKENDIPYEAQSKHMQNMPNGGVVIAVEEGDYEKAKRLLMRHRKRKSSDNHM